MVDLCIARPLHRCDTFGAKQVIKIAIFSTQNLGWLSSASLLEEVWSSDFMLFENLFDFYEFLAWEATIAVASIAPGLPLDLFNFLVEFWTLLELNHCRPCPRYCITFESTQLFTKGP